MTQADCLLHVMLPWLQYVSLYMKKLRHCMYFTARNISAKLFRCTGIRVWFKNSRIRLWLRNIKKFQLGVSAVLLLTADTCFVAVPAPQKYRDWNLLGYRRFFYKHHSLLRITIFIPFLTYSFFLCRFLWNNLYLYALLSTRSHSFINNAFLLRQLPLHLNPDRRKAWLQGWRWCRAFC